MSDWARTAGTASSAVVIREPSMVLEWVVRRRQTGKVGCGVGW